MATAQDSQALVVLFDGTCGLCDGFVRFATRRDRSGRLRFCAMQSELGRALLVTRGFAPDLLDTLVVLDGERSLIRSDAVLATLRVLPAPWSWLAATRILPQALRDLVYRFVAKHRHAFSGPADACEGAPPEGGAPRGPGPDGRRAG